MFIRFIRVPILRIHFFYELSRLLRKQKDLPNANGHDACFSNSTKSSRTGKKQSMTLQVVIALAE